VDGVLTRTTRERPSGCSRRPDRGRPDRRPSVVSLDRERRRRLRRQRTTYDYAGQDPINGYDLDGTFPGSGLLKKAKKVLGKAKEASLEVIQEAPYAAYYTSYQALEVFQNRAGDIASKTLLPAAAARAFLVQTEAIGFAGNAAIDKARGKSMYDDARKDSILPNVIAKHWNPSWLQTYLPGGGTRPNGSHFIDFRH